MEKRTVKVGSLLLGPGQPVRIQTMTDCKTADLETVTAEAQELERAGAELIRLAVVDADDAAAFKTLKSRLVVPLIADIHFDYRLALQAIAAGADKIRINPGNTPKTHLREIVDACKDRRVPIRIGLNSGSLGSKTACTDYLRELEVTLAIFESLGFYDLVLSLKTTDPQQTVELNRLAAARYPYPLHLGVTEAGYGKEALMKTAAALVPLLNDGIGSTVRISLSEPPLAEVEAAKYLLKALGLKKNVPTLISCPTCGRTTVDVQAIAALLAKRLLFVAKDVKVAVMGCPVNGPGEARAADFGIAGNNGKFVVFERGRIIFEAEPEAALAYLERKIADF